MCCRMCIELNIYIYRHFYVIQAKPFPHVYSHDCMMSLLRTVIWWKETECFIHGLYCTTQE